MSRANVAVVRRLHDDVLNGGQLELIPELFAGDFVSHRRGMPAVTTLLGAAVPAGPPLEQLISVGSQTFNTANLFAGVAIFAVAGLILTELLQRAEAVLAPWRATT